MIKFHHRRSDSNFFFPFSLSVLRIRVNGANLIPTVQMTGEKWEEKWIIVNLFPSLFPFGDNIQRSAKSKSLGKKKKDKSSKQIIQLHFFHTKGDCWGSALKYKHTDQATTITIKQCCKRYNISIQPQIQSKENPTVIILHKVQLISVHENGEGREYNHLLWQ